MLVCPTCGYENEDFFMFCLSCGADLAAASSSAPAEVAAPEPAALAPEPGLAPDKVEPPFRREPTSEFSATKPPALDQPPTLEPLGAAVGTKPFVAAGAAASDTEADTLAMQLQRCPSCGAVVNPAADSCGTCDRVLAKEQPALGGAQPSGGPVSDRGSPRGRLVLIREDGSDGDDFTLYSNHTVIGREGADVSFANDEFLAARHAEFIYDGDAISVVPHGTTNGVFRKIHGQEELLNADSFRLGQELLHFELLREIMGAPPRDEESTLELGSPLPPDCWGRLSQIVASEVGGAVFLLTGDEVFLGRERGDITFPDDGYVSGSHAVINRRDGRFFLKDLGSSNGTYVRLKGPTPLEAGDLILAGQQLFRIEP